MAKYYSPPNAGDIVQCRFPQDRVRQPGPKERPALVIEVERYALPDGATEIFVTVAYGTSQGVGERHPGEFTIASRDLHAGLVHDTKFDLRNRVKLPFDDDWFAPSPNERFGAHPKRGIVNTADPEMKRRLSSAIAELKRSARRKALDMASPSPKGKRIRP